MDKSGRKKYITEEWKKFLRKERNRRILHMVMEYMLNQQLYREMGFRVICRYCRRDVVMNQQRTEEREALSVFLKEFLYWGGL
jgi:hypothetical protein